MSGSCCLRVKFWWRAERSLKREIRYWPCSNRMILAPTFDYPDLVRCRSCLELAPFKPPPFIVRTVQTIGERVQVADSGQDLAFKILSRRSASASELLCSSFSS